MRLGIAELAFRFQHVIQPLSTHGTRESLGHHPGFDRVKQTRSPHVVVTKGLGRNVRLRLLNEWCRGTSTGRGRRGGRAREMRPPQAAVTNGDRCGVYPRRFGNDH